MPGSRVDRLRLLCRAPMARQREALALRGRLDRAARMHLPAALEGALERVPGAPGHGERRVYIERLAVPIDFDATAYDDVTLATLWAGRVRAAVEREGRGHDGVHIFDDDAAYVRAALLEVLEHGRLSWWFDDVAPPGPRRAIELLAALDAGRAAALVAGLSADAPVALRLYGRLAPDERRAVALALAGARAWSRLRDPLPAPHRAAGASLPAAASPPVEGDGNRPEAPSGDGSSATARADEDVARAWRGGLRPALNSSEWLALIRYAARNGLVAAPRGTVGPEPDAASRSRAPSARSEGVATGSAEAGRPADAQRDAPTSEPADGSSERAVPDTEGGDVERTAWWTGSAGLVLLYPWLAHFLNDDAPEAEPHGGLSAAVVRRLLALGELAAPRERAMLHDPLLRLLAGADPAHPGGEPPDLPPEGHAVEAAAEAVLTRLAGSLRGFERSSPEYVRRYFVRRGGLVEPLDGGAVRVRLEAAPLDVVLTRLPYPLTAFRLPWTPVVHIEVPRDA